MHLAVFMDMYFETPSTLIPLLTNFAVAIFASNHAYTLLSRYEYFYITITIVNFISVYQYIGILRTSVQSSVKQPALVLLTIGHLKHSFCPIGVPLSCVFLSWKLG